MEKGVENNEETMYSSEISNNSDSGSGKERLCRSEKKRRLREQNMLHKKTHRKEKKLQRKEKKLQRKERLKQAVQLESVADEIPHTSKRELKLACERRCKEALLSGLRVCVDLSMEELMSDKERSKVAQQLCRLYGSNRRSASPFHVYFMGLKKDGLLYRECVRKNEGFENYLIDMMEASLTEVFEAKEIVYLSPDAENALTSLETSKAYVIGGLVDESVKKNVTKLKCDQSQLNCVRLPVPEYMEREEGRSAYSTVLSLNQVFDILLEFHSTRNWSKALSQSVPKRKGYVIKKDSGHSEQCPS